MMSKILDTIYWFKNKDYIAKTPSMYKTGYDVEQVTEEEWRVMRRLGARDPRGITRAMKKYNVDTIPELIEMLDHFEPQRRPLERLRLALARMIGGINYNPHKKAMEQSFRNHRNAKQVAEIKQRMNMAKRYYNDVR